MAKNPYSSNKRNNVYSSKTAKYQKKTGFVYSKKGDSPYKSKKEKIYK